MKSEKMLAKFSKIDEYIGSLLNMQLTQNNGSTIDQSSAASNLVATSYKRSP